MKPSSTQPPPASPGHVIISEFPKLDSSSDPPPARLSRLPPQAAEEAYRNRLRNINAIISSQRHREAIQSRPDPGPAPNFPPSRGSHQDSSSGNVSPTDADSGRMVLGRAMKPKFMTQLNTQCGGGDGGDSKVDSSSRTPKQTRKLCPATKIRNFAASAKTKTRESPAARSPRNVATETACENKARPPPSDSNSSSNGDDSYVRRRLMFTARRNCGLVPRLEDISKSDIPGISVEALRSISQKRDAKIAKLSRSPGVPSWKPYPPTNATTLG